MALTLSLRKPGWSGLAKIDEHIETVTQNRDETVEKQFQSLTKDAHPGGPRVKSPRSKRP